MKEHILPLCLLVLVSFGGGAAAQPAPTGAAADSSLVESGYVEVAGGRIFYEAAGRGPAIVMIHDGILHRETWNAQFAEFARSYRVIRWDRRGYGRSDPPAAPFSNLEDLRALMTTLDVERATLIGCSAGGLLAICFALDHPEMVTSLVLVGPIVSGFGFSEHFRTRGDRGQPAGDAPVEEQVRYWTSVDPWLTAPESAAARQTMRSLLTANPQDLTGSGTHARWPRTPAMPRLPEIKVPTLIVAGESDIPDVHAHIGVIEAGIPGSRRLVLARSGHLPHLEVPGPFNKAVLEFLAAAR